MTESSLRVFDTLRELVAAAEAEFVRRAEESIAARGRFAVALAGGNTPRALYEQLAERALPWERVHFFFGDERCVPPQHEDSNYRMANEALFSRIDVPEENVHRMRAELEPPARAAAEYEAEIARFFALAPGAFPTFDLVLLGMGPDGHTASLFPGSTALDEKEKVVCATWVEKLRAWRITLTLPAVNHAARVLFVVSGADKAEAVRDVFAAKPSATPRPSALVRPTHGELLWFVDRNAR